eukprot:gene17318-8896_t
MGQGSSSRHKTTDFSKSESTLEFEPGKKLISHSQQSFERSTAPFDREVRPPPSVVSDDDDDDFSKPGKPRRRLTVPTVFRWEYGGKEVYLSGSFNEWKTRIPMSYGGGEFTAIIELLAGEHHFKFLVDGHWIHDPNQDMVSLSSYSFKVQEGDNLIDINSRSPFFPVSAGHHPCFPFKNFDQLMPPLLDFNIFTIDGAHATVNDTFGGRNNVVVVKDSDFDAAEALDEDAGMQKGSFGSLRQISPPGSYGQLIPSHHTPVVVHDTLHSAVPPMLPPHLLNVILNKEAIDQEDLTLLPVPHHVALNHLYALSIKDAVMTLSATHRYRRKYITTVLYKPVK